MTNATTTIEKREITEAQFHSILDSAGKAGAIANREYDVDPECVYSSRYTLSFGGTSLLCEARAWGTQNRYFMVIDWSEADYDEREEC